MPNVFPVDHSHDIFLALPCTVCVCQHISGTDQDRCVFPLRVRFCLKEIKNNVSLNYSHVFSTNMTVYNFCRLRTALYFDGVKYQARGKTE